ncbi:hypothetical protein ZWY2020_003656 [Hordeum vulgare]|nr:hypothetical protein ZWY2020_003656 [Hordeum vulgare]
MGHVHRALPELRCMKISEKMKHMLRTSVMEYEEHEKRAWSVDFSRTEPKMLVSGSDDCKVKVWCTNQEASAINIDMKANIFSIKYNPGSSYYVAVVSRITT